MYSAVLREVNLRIYELAGNFAMVDAHFVCECGRPDCDAARIEMPLTEMADCLAADGCAIVVPGHVFAGTEIVRQSDAYLLVRHTAREINAADAALAAGQVPALAAADSTTCILVADEQMHLTYASDGACDLVGWERAELLRLSVPDIVLDRELAERLYAEYVASGEQHGRIILRRKDNTAVAADYRAYVMDVDGTTHHISQLVPVTTVGLIEYA